MGGSKAEAAYKSPYPEPNSIGSGSDAAQKSAAAQSQILAASQPAKTESTGILGGASSSSSTGSGNPATYG